MEWGWGGGGVGFFFQAEDGIRDRLVTGVQTCALPISGRVYLLSVTATKPSGAETVAASVFTVDPTADDTAAPTGFGSSPSDGSIVADAQPSIEGVVQDAESGVDSASIVAELDGAAAAFTFLPPTSGAASSSWQRTAR